MKEKLLQFLFLVIGVVILRLIGVDLALSALGAGIFLVACCLFGFILDKVRTFLAKTFGVWVLYITFIGVMIHEMSHALLATLTGAKVVSVTLFQVKSKKGNLGEVKFTPRGNVVFRGIQTGLASVAPMFVGATLLVLGYIYLRPLLEGWQLGLFWYVMISIFMHMSLSKQDVKNIFSNIFSVFLFLILVSSCIFTFVVRV